MADTPAPPAAAPATTADTDPAADGPDWGTVLDIAGIAAGVALVVIVADIITDGRVISRRLQQRRQEREETRDPGD